MSAGQLVIDIDRLSLRPGVTQVSFTAEQLLLFYNHPPLPPTQKDVDCTSGQSLSFSAATVTLDLTSTGRTNIATANAPPGNLQEVWLVLSSATVTENGLVRPLHTSLNCSSGDNGVVRLTSANPSGVTITTNQVTEIAAQFDPNTDLDHKDPDNAGGKGNDAGNPDVNGDLHGGLWTIAEALPFLQVINSPIVDGQIIVRFKDGTSASDITNAITAQSMTVLRKWPSTNYYVLQAPNGADERPILQYYAGLGTVQYTSPNTYVGHEGVGPDPQFQNQLQWPQVGLFELSTGMPDPSFGWNPALSSDPQWIASSGTGTFRPVVAVIDDGIDLTNPDIYPNIFINVDEVPQEVLNNVGKLRGFGDWRDLDADGDGWLTFADLDATNTICATTTNCAMKKPNVACTPVPPMTKCTPLSLVSGAGRADPAGITCGTTPHPITNNTWEDGIDGTGGKGCNGFVDDIVGWNFSNDGLTCPTSAVVDNVTGCNKVGVATPTSECFSTPSECFSTTARLSHGTTVASIVGAVGDNTIDTAGINWSVRILPVQPLLNNFNTLATAGTVLFRDSLYSAFLYAASVRLLEPPRHGVDVVNTSLGFEAYDNGLPQPTCANDGKSIALSSSKLSDFVGELQQELNDFSIVLTTEGTLGVFPAGNCSLDHDDSRVFNYPSSIVGTNVLRVAAVGTATHTNADQLSTFSDFGKSSIDIAAPGEFFVPALVDPTTLTYVAAMWPCPDPTLCQGTSFASPMVAGAAALLIAANPSLAGQPCQIADQITRNAKPLPGVNVAGGHRLDIQQALVNLTPPTTRCL